MAKAEAVKPERHALRREQRQHHASADGSDDRCEIADHHRLAVAVDEVGVPTDERAESERADLEHSRRCGCCQKTLHVAIVRRSVRRVKRYRRVIPLCQGYWTWGSVRRADLLPNKARHLYSVRSGCLLKRACGSSKLARVRQRKQALQGEPTGCEAARLGPAKRKALALLSSTRVRV